MTSSSTSPPDGPGNSRRRQPPRDADPISAGLRRMWADAEQEPVPEALMALIMKIGSGTQDGGPEHGK